MYKKFISLITLTAMLLSIFISFSASAVEVYSYTNGNEAEFNFQEGIFTAESSGSGLFAVALYKDSELISVKVSENEAELEPLKLNMIIDNAEGTSMKIFRFDENGTPLMVNKELEFNNSDNIRVYVNETFDNNISKYTVLNGTTKKITDGRLELVSDSGANESYSVPVSTHGRYLIYEAEYQLGDDFDISNIDARLCRMSYANSDGDTAYAQLLRLRDNGEVYIGNKEETWALVGTLSTERAVKIALKMDFDQNTYSVYFDGSETPVIENAELAASIDPSKKYSETGFFIGHTGGDDKTRLAHILIDNIRIYEGTEFKDIGNLIENVHKTDYAEELLESKTYKRPSAEEIAKKVLDSGHPRVMLTPEKVEEIKNSTDENVIEWKKALIERADSVPAETYKYLISSTGSMQNFNEGIERVMDLGLAYLLTGNTDYSDRAYKEAEVLMNYKRTYPTADGGNAAYDDWNSYSYLDVGEGSLFMAICYDWMYDAWTEEQKNVMTDAVMQKGIGLSYDILHGYKLAGDEGRASSYKTGTGWYDSKNNWGSVCNGGVYTAAIAFMEQDPFKCATVAEAAMRNVEYMMSSYAPDGAWAEGPSYWGYALKYLAAMLSTMEASCGTVYGIDEAAGFSNTGLYSLSLEGKAGVANFGDVNGKQIKSPAVFYLSKLFNKAEYTAANLYAMDKFGFNSNAFDLIYYDPDMNKADYNVPTAYRYKGTETVSFTSGLGDDDSFIAISGGKSSGVSHDHLDSGGVIVDMKGQRLFYDIGAEHYNAKGYFGENRYKYFRTRPESHNVFIINPEDISDGYNGQDLEAVSYIIDESYDQETHTATMDLGAAYARDASKASRTIKVNEDNSVVITDNITLIKNTNNIYWNWYVKTRTEDDKHNITNVGEITISEDKKSATIKLNDIEYKVSFEANGCDYELAVEEAEKENGGSNQYADTETALSSISRHDNKCYQRLVVKMENCSENLVELKTIIE